MKQYWQFYWPLALTGVALVLAVQFQNATLARYPDAVVELAVFALAVGVWGFFNACLQFTAQLSNVYARSPQGNRRSYRFVCATSLLLTTGLLLIATSPAGAALVQTLYGVDAALTERITHYMTLLAAMLFLNGQRHYLTGLLIQSRLTGWVTMLNLTHLVLMITGLVVGFSLGLDPPAVIVGSEVIATSIKIALLIWVKRRLYRAPSQQEHQSVTYQELFAFFVPVSTTGVMFALSRPVLYAFISRTPDSITAVAVLRVAFDFSMLFQQAANQFRHFFVTFGLDKMVVKRRFMTIICAGLTTGLLFLTLSGLAYWIWVNLMGIPAHVAELAASVLLVLCLMPTAIIYRNYFHGILMVQRRTSGMAIGGILRVVGIYVCAQFAFSLGLLNHTIAAVILILGFYIEAVVVHRVVRRHKQMDNKKWNSQINDH